MNSRPIDRRQRYTSDADRLNLIAEALEDESLNDRQFRSLVRSIMFPSRVDDDTFRWAKEQAERIIAEEPNQ